MSQITVWFTKQGSFQLPCYDSNGNETYAHLSRGANTLPPGYTVRSDNIFLRHYPYLYDSRGPLTEQKLKELATSVKQATASPEVSLTIE